MISDKKAVELAKTLAQFCKEQTGCQNCVLHKHASDHWDCHVNGFDLRFDLPEIEANYEAKRKRRGYMV